MSDRQIGMDEEWAMARRREFALAEIREERDRRGLFPKFVSEELLDCWLRLFYHDGRGWTI